METKSFLEPSNVLIRILVSRTPRDTYPAAHAAAAAHAATSATSAVSAHAPSAHAALAFAFAVASIVSSTAAVARAGRVALHPIGLSTRVLSTLSARVGSMR